MGRPFGREKKGNKFMNFPYYLILVQGINGHTCNMVNG